MSNSPPLAVSTKLNHALEVSDIDDDDSSVDAAGLEEEEESDNLTLAAATAVRRQFRGRGGQR